MIRSIIFLSIAILSLTASWPFTISAACIYAFWYEGIELIVLGFFLDAYIGHAVPWLFIPAIYTLTMTGILLFFWGLKPLLYITYDETFV